MTKNKIMHRVVVFFGLLIAISGTLARAQYEDGSLIGTIRDASGAVVPNAAVTVTNVNTGIVTKVASSSSGDYEVPALRVGVYTIEADAAGFAPAEAKNITISVAGRERIDLTLNVGQANATTVEVTDVALQLETETSERGETVSGYQTEALPLVSRNYSDLLALVTGSRQAGLKASDISWAGPSGLLKLLQLQGNKHPFAVVRFAELDRWAGDGEYRTILAGNYPRREDDPDTSVGDEFRAAAKSYQDSWNRSADPLIGAVRGVANGAAEAGTKLFNRFAGGERRDNDDDDDE